MMKKIIFFILFIGCGGLSISSDYVPINPSYIFSLIGFSLFFLFFGFRKFKMDKLLFMLFILNIFYFIVIFILYQDKQSLQFITSYLVFIPIYILIADRGITLFEKQVNIGVNIFIIYAITDLIYRINKYGSRINENFYLIKIDSLIFEDTNYLGTFYAILFTFLVLLPNKTFKNKWIKLFIIIVIIIGTYSRGAIISTILILFIMLYNFIKSKKVKIYLLTSIFLSSLFIVPSIFNILLKDSSFNKRMQFYLSYFLEKKIDFMYSLTGVGFTNSKLVLDGKYAHSIFLVILIEKGYIGFILFFTLLVYIFIKYKKTRYIIIIFILTNAITTSYFHAILFVPLAIILGETSYRNRGIRKPLETPG